MLKKIAEITQEIEYNEFDVGEEVIFKAHGCSLYGIVISQNVPDLHDKDSYVRIQGRNGFTYSIFNLHVQSLNDSFVGRFVISGFNNMRLIVKNGTELMFIDKNYEVCAGGIPENIDDKGFTIHGIKYYFLNKSVNMNWPS